MSTITSPQRSWLQPVPVDDIPERSDIIRATILVVQVVGVFPYIQSEDGCAPYFSNVHRGIVLVGRTGHHQFLFAGHDEPCPAGTETGSSCIAACFPLICRNHPGRGRWPQPGRPEERHRHWGPSASQNRLWLKNPPPLLRTAPEILPTLASISSMLLPSHSVPAWRCSGCWYKLRGVCHGGSPWYGRRYAVPEHQMHTGSAGSVNAIISI